MCSVLSFPKDDATPTQNEKSFIYANFVKEDNKDSVTFVEDVSPKSRLSNNQFDTYTEVSTEQSVPIFHFFRI